MIIANFPCGSDTAALEALRQQVSNLLNELTNNPDYAPTAEVVDIRTGYDGTLYKSAGDAVRALGADVLDLQSILPILQATLANKVDGAYVEDGYLYLTSGDAIVAGPLGPFSGTGGGGAETYGSTLKLVSRMPSKSFSAMDTAESVDILYNWTSYDNEDNTPTGKGTASWYVGGVRVAMQSVEQGDNSFNIKDYLIAGTDNTVKLIIEDSYGTSKPITWTITVSSYGLTWNVGTMDLHGSSVLGLRLIPTGDGDKIVHVTVDGTEICGETVSTTGRTLAVNVPTQLHGAHVIEAWIEVTVNGEPLTTTHLRHVGIWVDENNPAPIVAFYLSAEEVAQYATTNNEWMVYDPSTENTTVQRKVNGVLDSTVTVGRAVQTWAYRATASGDVVLSLECGAVSAEKTLSVSSIGYDISPVTSGLVLDLDPTGHSNTEAGVTNFGYVDADKVIHPLAFSDNFDWKNGGFKQDSEGVTAFVIRRGTYVDLDTSLFSDNASTQGKEVKIIFKATAVRNYDAEIMRCKAGNVGIVLQAQQATLTSELTTITSPYCEDRKIEMDVNIHASNDGAFACVWLGGKPSRIKDYTSADSWQQSVPSTLHIGSDDCDVWIYRIKMYSNALSRYEVLDNFIADCANPTEMIARYERNDIFTVSGEIDRAKLAQRNPNLRVIRLSAPKMTTAKTDEVVGDIEHVLVNGTAKDNNTAKGITFKAQGTSSTEYGLAGLNLDIDYSDAEEWIDGNGDDMTEYAMTDKSIPVNYFNLKVNIASSENANNVCNADDYNTFNPCKVAPKAADERVRDTVEGHPCAIFFTNTNTTAVTVGARTVKPGETILYASGDMNNSKKNFKVFGQDNSKYAYQCCVEFLNNNNEQCRFISDDLTDETWDGNGNFEFRYPKSPTAAMKGAFQRMLSWVVSTNPNAATNAVLSPQVVYDGVTYTNDTAEYRKAKFVNEFENYFSKKSMLFHYLFTERHLMTDNRAKNVFFSYEPDPDYGGDYRWNVCKDYDNDTSEGNDNSGGLTFTYGMEDTDSVGASMVFNAADSVLWCNIRDFMFEDLATMYKSLEGSDCWSSQRYLAKFKAHQETRPEALVMEDMYNKYVLPYLNRGETRYLSMMYGDKDEQREQFERYQEAYIASKYSGAFATADRISLRTSTTISDWVGVEPNGDMVITPYADVYVVVKYGNAGTVKVRAKRGVATPISCPAAALNDTETYIYSSSMLTDVGNLSALYTKLAELVTASKLLRLQLGSSEAGYVNSAFGSSEGGLSFGSNELLEYVDIRGLINLKSAQDLSSLTSLKEFYASGSGITGVTFAVGSPIQKVSLPAITTLTARGLLDLESFTMEPEKLQVVWIENTPKIDIGSILESAQSIVRGRLTDVDLSFDTPDAIIRLIGKAGISSEGAIISNFVLTGSVHFGVMTQDELTAITEAFPDLEVTYDTIAEAHTVYFYDSDGTTLLYSEIVRHGAAAVNPVTAGYIQAPKRASTVQYDYTFAGWDTDYSNVTSDIDVKAVYSARVRKYVVNFYNGTTLLQSTAVEAYGSVAYAGEDLVAPSGMIWGGWDQLTTNVTQNLDVKAVFISPTMPDSVPADYDYLYSDDPNDKSAFTFSDFWGVIYNDLADSYFKVGDKIKICPNTNVFADTEIILQVYGFKHFKLADGSGKFAGVVFGMLGVMNTGTQMNSTNTNEGGWPSCKMRTFLNETILKALPQHWKSVIQKVEVKSSAGGTSATIVTSEDKLFLFSQAEVGFDVSSVPYCNEVDAEAEKVTFSLFTDNNSRVKKTYNGTGSAMIWWLRSPDPGSSSNFRSVSNGGTGASGNASNGNSVAFGFCI